MTNVKPSLVATVGTINGTAVNADHGSGFEHSYTVKVLLSQNYVMGCPPGYPSRPSFTGAAIRQYPHTIAAGTTLILHKPEADAIVAAGGGSYA